LKLLEEIGEFTQAYLAVTSQANDRRKSWADVREELADCLIVALDIAWTVFPTEDYTTLFTPGETVTPQKLLPFGVYDIFFIGTELSSFGQHINNGAYMLARINITRVVDRLGYMVLTHMPDQDDWDLDDVSDQLIEEVERKLAKWTVARLNNTAVTQAVA
jgi:hypothetical protein